MNTSEPSAIDVAFAISLNCAKPPNLSVREFVLELRGRIHRGQRPQLSRTYEESQKNYVNAASYFESKYKEAEKRNEMLSSRTILLEEQIEDLKKMASNEGQSVQKSKKRKRKSLMCNNDFTVEEFKAHIDQIAASFDTSATSEHCQHLLGCLFELRRTQQRTTDSYSEYEKSLEKLSLSFQQVLSAASDLSEAWGTSDNWKALQSLPRILYLVFASLECALSNSEGSSTLVKCQFRNNTMIYNILRMLDSALSAIRIICASSRAGPKQSTKQRRWPNVDSSANQNSAVPSRTDKLEHLNILVRTYITLLLKSHSESCPSTSLLKREMYSNLLEGTLYLLLSRIGEVAYALTFGTRRKESLEAEILSTSPSDDSAHRPISRPGSKRSKRPPKQSQVSENSSKRQTTNEKEAANIEGKSLIPFLELILPHFSTIHSSSLPAERNNTATPITTRMLTQPLKILQNTLLEGIFGPAQATETGLNPEIYGQTLNSFASPLAPAHTQFEEDNNDKHTERHERGEHDNEWFVKRIWELVGWDVLACSFQTD